VSDVEPTMSFIDHASKATVNYNGDVTFNPPHHVIDAAPAPVITFPEQEVIGPHLERLVRAIEKLSLQVTVEAPKIEIPASREIIVNVPEQKSAENTITIHGGRALIILAIMAAIQVVMMGVLIWRS